MEDLLSVLIRRKYGIYFVIFYSSCCLFHLYFLQSFHLISLHSESSKQNPKEVVLFLNIVGLLQFHDQN